MKRSEMVDKMTKHMSEKDRLAPEMSNYDYMDKVLKALEIEGMLPPERGWDWKDDSRKEKVYFDAADMWKKDSSYMAFIITDNHMVGGIDNEWEEE